MRVLFLTTDYPPHGGGVATLALEQSVRLARGGHDVRVETVDFGPLPELCRATPRLEVHAHTVGAPPVVRLIPLARIVGRAARQFRPEILYAATHRGFGLPMAFTAYRRGCPYALYVHGNEILTELRASSRRHVIAWLLRNAAILFSNSYNTRTLLETHFSGLPPVEVLHPGIDHAKFDDAKAQAHARELRRRWLETKGLGAESVVLLSLCRLSRQKGIDKVLEVLAALRSSGRLSTEWLYVIAGSGPDEPRFQQMSLELGLADRVLFAGQVAYEENAPVVLAADVYVQPSQPHGIFIESFGISFIEAQYAGLPCIATRWGGIPEAVRAGETAVLVEPGDTAGLAAAVAAMINNSEIRRSMGAAARRWASGFSWNSHVDRLGAKLAAAVEQSQVVATR